MARADCQDTASAIVPVSEVAHIGW